MRVYQLGFYAKCLLPDRQLRSPLLANLRSIRKLHSWRGVARYSRSCNRILGTRYAYKTLDSERYVH